MVVAALKRARKAGVLRTLRFLVSQFTLITVLSAFVYVSFIAGIRKPEKRAN